MASKGKSAWDKEEEQGVHGRSAPKRSDYNAKAFPYFQKLDSSNRQQFGGGDFAKGDHNESNSARGTRASLSKAEARVSALKKKLKDYE